MDTFDILKKLEISDRTTNFWTFEPRTFYTEQQHEDLETRKLETIKKATDGFRSPVANAAIERSYRSMKGDQNCWSSFIPRKGGDWGEKMYKNFYHDKAPSKHRLSTFGLGVSF